MGLVSGVAAGTIIVGFRYAIEFLQHGFMPDLPSEAFEALEPIQRFALPAGGGLLLGLAYWLLPAPARTVGREAPNVHLGAGVASLLGRRLRLPNNSIRTLVACGAAAAIAASFNTPLAGVIFAMEVIMVEYTIAEFVPVILSAVAATAITRAVFGEQTAFLVPLLGLASLWELAYITLMGALIGLISAAFVAVIRMLGRIAQLEMTDNPYVIMLAVVSADFRPRSCSSRIPFLRS